MARILGIIVAAIIVFLAAVLVPLAMTGRLKMATLQQLIGGKEAPPPAAPAESVGPLSTKIKEEQERLRTWEKELQDREDRLDQREQALDQTLSEVTKAQDEVKKALGQLDEQHQAAVMQVAKTMEKMEPKNAATDLAAMAPEDAATIVRLISDKNRGAILDEMPQQPRGKLLEALQAKKL